LNWAKVVGISSTLVSSLELTFVDVWYHLHFISFQKKIIQTHQNIFHLLY
jgi:hypothetical protein